MKTEIYSSKVGKRWFKLVAFDVNKELADVEASYEKVGFRWDHRQGKYIKDGLKWIITGKGARKYRQQIIDHLEGKYFDGDSETN